MLPNIPAFAVQQHADLAIPVTHPALCDLAYPHPQLRPWFLMSLVAIRTSHHQKNPAGMPLARPVKIAQMIDHQTATRRLQNFFVTHPATSSYPGSDRRPVASADCSPPGVASSDGPDPSPYQRTASSIGRRSVR